MAETPTIPIRRRHLGLYALSETGFLVMVLVVFSFVPASWPPLVVGLVAGALVLPILLLKNLVPVIPRWAKRISTAGSLLTFAVLLSLIWIDNFSHSAMVSLALVPSVLTGVLLTLFGARRP